MASNLSSSRQARSGPIASANGSTRAADDLLSVQTKGHATLALAWLSDRIHVTTRATYVAVTGSLIAVMLLGIFFRYVLNSSLAWSDEVALVLFFWATWISIVVAYREGRHLSIDLLTRKARGTWIARLGVVREAMNGAFLAVLLISGVLAFEITSGGATDALKLPLSLSFAALPIAAGLMLVHWLSEALHTLTRWQVLATIVLGSLIVSL